MIEVRVGELATAVAAALVRPVATDFSPVTPTMRRFDEAAGATVAAQCARLGDLPLGSAAITAAGDLPAEFIVHVAVRSATENPTPAVVRQGLLNALRRLSDWEIDRVAVVPLGTGAGNLDADESAAAMVPLLAEHVREAGRAFSVTIVVEDSYQETVYRAAVARLGTARPEPRVPEPDDRVPGSDDRPGERVGLGS